MQQHSHQPAGLGAPGLRRALSAGPSVPGEGLQDVELSVSSRQQHMRHDGGRLVLSEPHMAAFKSQLLQATVDADSPAALFAASNTYLMFLAAQQASTAGSSCTSQPSSSSSSSGIDASAFEPSEKPLTAEDTMQLRLELCRALSEPVWDVAIAEARATANGADAALGSIKAAAAASAVVAKVAPGGAAAATAAPLAALQLSTTSSSGGGGGHATCMRACSDSLTPMQQQQEGSLARIGSTIKLVFEPVRDRSASKKGGRLGRHLQAGTGATGLQGRSKTARATAAAPAATQPLRLPGSSPARFPTAAPPAAAQPSRVPDAAATTLAAASTRPLRAPSAGPLTVAAVAPSLLAHDVAAANFAAEAAAAAATSNVPAPGAAAAAAIAAAKHREQCRANVMAALQQQQATGMVGCKRSHSCMEPGCVLAGPYVTSSSRSMY